MTNFSLLVFIIVLTLFSEPSSLSFTILLVLSFSFQCVYFTFSSGSHSLIGLLVFVLYLLVTTFLSTSSLFIFFVTYELSLYPVCLLLLLFGYQPEKLQASSWLLLYTVCCSVPLFMLAVRNMNSVSFGFSKLSVNSGFFVCLSFMVKSPLYTLHSWLPKAHVEAPLSGSMLLAGVILKLGGYGLLLCSPYLQQSSFIYIYLSLTGGVVCSLICCRCWDMKSLVAYSSVVHMGAVTLGALSGTELGFWVSCRAIVGHTFLSPLLFVLASEVYYCTGSRGFVHGHCSSAAGGLLLLLSLCFGMNFGLPPALNFWVEVSLFSVMSDVFVTSLFLLILTSFFVFLYCILFILLSSGGSPSSKFAHISSYWVFLSPLAARLGLPFSGFLIYN